MPPISRTKPASSRHRVGERGYSLLEMMIVLVLIGVATALVLPRGAVMMDRVVAHAVFFDFQRQVADLRRAAYRAQATVFVYSTDRAPAGDPQARTLTLRPGWSYRLDRPMTVTGGGDCSPTAVEILDHGRRIMQLRADAQACRFIRVS